MAVPNTSTFTLQQVVNEIGTSKFKGPGDLKKCFQCLATCVNLGPKQSTKVSFGANKSLRSLSLAPKLENKVRRLTLLRN